VEWLLFLLLTTLPRASTSAARMAQSPIRKTLSRVEEDRGAPDENTAEEVYVRRRAILPVRQVQPSAQPALSSCAALATETKHPQVAPEYPNTENETKERGRKLRASSPPRMTRTLAAAKRAGKSASAAIERKKAEKSRLAQEVLWEVGE